MRGHDLFRTVALVAVVLAYITILLGGNVMASDSGLACPDWPTCHGTFLPPLVGHTGIEWVHRLSALVLSLTIGVLSALGLVFERRRPILLRLIVASSATVVAQAFLGGVVVTSDLTVGVVLLHLGLATILFALLVVVALLANLKQIPRRWVDWAHQASTEVPAALDETGTRERRSADSPTIGAVLPRSSLTPPMRPG